MLSSRGVIKSDILTLTSSIKIWPIFSKYEYIGLLKYFHGSFHIGHKKIAFYSHDLYCLFYLLYCSWALETWAVVNWPSWGSQLND